ncbi:MAG: sigma-70 family RNA polymerase sigma factor [Oscillospiraceae bacterium]|nr:sigma-70 family RNA polymerase sigma factor [Oscillospiraceae bacterium]
MALRQERKRTGEVSLQEPIGVDRDGNEITVGDVICAENDVVEDVERRMDIDLMRRAVAAVKDERERRVIILRFGLEGGEPLPQREVGKLLGISRSYVSRIEKKALEGIAASLKSANAGDHL